MGRSQTSITMRIGKLESKKKMVLLRYLTYNSRILNLEDVLHINIPVFGFS